jgi:hypothetical protein
LRFDQERIRLDALEFHSAAAGGLRLFSLDNHISALEAFTRAKALYVGNYLPDMSGKIISNTRDDLESLYLSAVIDGMPLAQNSRWPGCERRAKPELYKKSFRQPDQSLQFCHE